MAHHHHHHHHHGDHDHDHDHEPIEEPLDSANQSLAEALRVSFTVLKGIMLVLVVVYLFSNVRTVGSSEQAIVVRMGELLPGVRDAGLIWAFPYPIDQVVRLPTKKSNDLLVASHTFKRLPEEIGKPLSFISRGHGGLNPSVDGSLLTADSGLVHMQWKVTYKIDDVSSFLREFVGDKVAAAEALLKTVLETTAIEVAGELTAEELIRTRVDHVQSEMRRRINERLTGMKAGIDVSLVQIDEPTPPISVRDAFDDTQKAESFKQKKINEAEQERTRILSEAAGVAYPQLLKLLDEMDAAKTDQERTLKRLAVDEMLMNSVEGKAGRAIKDAGAYHSKVVNRIQSDVELYRTLVPEYERNPSLLIGRLWETTRQRILDSAGVTKLYRPGGEQEFWLQVPLDPEQTRMDEELRMRAKEFDPKDLTPKHYVPLGVGQD